MERFQVAQPFYFAKVGGRGVRVSDDEVQIEFAMRFLLADSQEPRTLVAALVYAWPTTSTLQIIYVLTITAGTIEHMLAGPEIAHTAQELWRMAGLVAVDLYMMELMGLPRNTAADLLAYWQAHDGFFLG